MFGMLNVELWCNVSEKNRQKYLESHRVSGMENSYFDITVFQYLIFHAYALYEAERSLEESKNSPTQEKCSEN